MRPLSFILLPFECKPEPSGHTVDFDTDLESLIKFVKHSLYRTADWLLRELMTERHFTFFSL